MNQLVPWTMELFEAITGELTEAERIEHRLVWPVVLGAVIRDGEEDFERCVAHVVEIVRNRELLNACLSAEAVNEARRVTVRDHRPLPDKRWDLKRD